MKIYYQFFRENHLLIISFKGDFSIETYKKSMRITQEDFWKNTNALLLDMRQTNPGNQQLIINELNEIRKTSNFGGYKVAYLVDSPRILANLHLYIEYTHSDDYNYFSTLKAAISHLDLNITEETIEKRLKNLSNIIE